MTLVDLSLELLVPAVTATLAAALALSSLTTSATGTPAKPASPLKAAAPRPPPAETTEDEQQAVAKLQARVRGNAAREVNRDPVIFERRLSTADL